jgi:putative membrane protein
MADSALAVGTNSAELWHVFKEIVMELMGLKLGAIVGSILFALIGVLIFWLCFVIIDKLTPYDLWGEIIEKQNVALGIVVAAMSLGICIIVAAAIHG